MTTECPQGNNPNADQPYLWRIYDMLKPWQDEEWGSAADFMENVAAVMQDWNPEGGPTPRRYRRNDEEEYPCEMPDCENSMLDGVHYAEDGFGVHIKTCWPCADQMPEEGDYIVDDRNGISLYKETFLGYYPEPDNFIKGYMQRNQWFASVWTLSDHGNFHRRELE